MSILALPSYYSSVNDNYGHHSYNESLIPDECCSFYAFDSSSMSVENHDLNFDEFITNCKAISHLSTSDRGAKMSNIENDSYDNTDEFVVKRISENFQELGLSLPIQTIVPEIESMVKKNICERTENKGSQVLFEISEPSTTTVNILFLVIHEDKANPNWHTSFMTLTRKGIQYSPLTQILLKTRLLLNRLDIYKIYGILILVLHIIFVLAVSVFSSIILFLKKKIFGQGPERYELFKKVQYK